MEREWVIAGLVDRDEAAWDSFLEQYSGMVYAIGGSLGLAPEDREDLLQKVCLSVLGSIGTLRDPSRLSSWIYTIAYRLGVDAVRRRREIPVAELPDGGDPSAGLQAPPTVEEDLERIERAAILLDAMARLDPRCRRLLGALYLEEPPLGYAAVAERERIPIGSVGPMRARCLEKMRDLLETLSNRASRASARRKPLKGREHHVGMRKGR